MKKEKRKLNLKKGIASIALATSLIFTGVPTVASAAVNPENIVKDEHYAEDRTAIRYDEMQTINEFFSIDVKVETIEKAIVLSDVINSYYPGPNMYSNTTCEEVLTIDIDKQIMVDNILKEVSVLFEDVKDVSFLMDLQEVMVNGVEEDEEVYNNIIIQVNCMPS